MHKSWTIVFWTHINVRTAIVLFNIWYFVRALCDLFAIGRFWRRRTKQQSALKSAHKIHDCVHACYVIVRADLYVEWEHSRQYENRTTSGILTDFHALTTPRNHSRLCAKVAPALRCQRKSLFSIWIWWRCDTVKTWWMARLNAKRGIE